VHNAYRICSGIHSTVAIEMGRYRLTPHMKKWIALRTIVADQQNKLGCKLKKLAKQERHVLQSSANSKARELYEIRRAATIVSLELESTARFVNFELGDEILRILIAKLVVEDARSHIRSIDQEVDSGLEEVSSLIDDIISDYRHAGLLTETHSDIHLKAARRVIRESLVKATEESIREGFGRLF
jgi:hypothetical protein